MRRPRLLALLTTLLLIAGLTTLTAVAWSRFRDDGVDRRPNVIVVMADDMRVDDLRFAPNTRRLVADRGLTFANSFSPNPICCPARASFLTGQYSHNHGVLSQSDPWGFQAFDDSRTLATSLTEAGYSTGFVGKYLNGYGRHRSSVSDVAPHRYVPAGWTEWRAGLKSQRFAGSTYHYWKTPYNANGEVDTSFHGRYQTDVVGELSRDIATAFSRDDKPFFLSVNYVAPHHGPPDEPDDPTPVRDDDGKLREFRTASVPPSVRGRFDDLITRPPGLPKDGSRHDVEGMPDFLQDQTSELNRAEKAALTEVTRQRAEAIWVMDQQIGELVETLEETGEWEDTVLVVTSDNGAILGEHGVRQTKGLALEPSMRVPLVVTGPGMRGGETRYDPITTVDLAATVLDLADARPPVRQDGTSRVPTMRHGDQGWDVPVLYSSIRSAGKREGFDDDRNAIGVRTPRYSMVKYAGGESELYDLRRDPFQDRNVWQDRAYRGVRQQLDDVWWRLKDCRGDACRVPMPEQLREGPAQNARSTSAYWRRIDRVYGWPKD